MEILKATERLPGKLSRLVPPEKISANEERLLSNAPEIDPQSLERAIRSLSELYLIHATEMPNRLFGGIKPFVKQSHPSGYIGFTFLFDESLDLDRCTFFSWPLQSDDHGHGQNLLLVSPSLLQDERCFVTPLDIRYAANPNNDENGIPLNNTEEEHNILNEAYESIFDGTYDELTDLTQPINLFERTIRGHEAALIKQTFLNQLKRNYFDKLVSGAVWMEYVARMLVAHGPEGIPLGEIKYHGPVTDKDIEGRITLDDYEELYKPYVEKILGEVRES